MGQTLDFPFHPPIEISFQIIYCKDGTEGRNEMAQKKISEIMKLAEFLNEEIKGVSKRLSRVTPREITERLGSLALLREKILDLPVEFSPELERKLAELYPALNKIKQKPS
jgi:hypothetical protein